MMKKKYIYFSLPFLLFCFGFYFLKNSYNKQNNKINQYFDVTQFSDGSINQYNDNQVNIDQNNVKKNDYNNNDDDDEQAKELKRQSVQAFFSPRDDIRSIIIRYIELEKKEIICAAFRLTDQKITKALFDAYDHGVKIIFIVDREGLSAMNSKLLHFVNQGIPIYYFPPLEDLSVSHSMAGLMHNKIMCFVGQRMILTGSFNFTKSAQDRNRENIIVIKNNDEIFNRYQAELKILKSESTLLHANKIPLYSDSRKHKKNK